MQELSSLLTEYGVPSILRYSHSLMALIKMDGTIIECNPACEAIRSANLVMDSLPSLLTLESRITLDHLVLLAVEKNIPTHGTLTLLSSEMDYDCTFIPVSDGRLLFLAELVTFDPALAERYQSMSRRAAQLKLDYEHSQENLKKKQKEIDLVVTQAREVASTDALTFLPNRRQIIGDLQREVIYSNRYRTPLSISMLDIDHFKAVNDTHGHAVGDLVLRQVASYMRDHIRTTDMVGRYGGEEFLVLLPNTDLDSACEQAERLCARIREAAAPAETADIHVTVSIGVAQYNPEQEDWQKLLVRADYALYDAKAAGRDRWAAAK
jgi:diguanylate cyclase (GGDEF)-like protein